LHTGNLLGKNDNRKCDITVEQQDRIRVQKELWGRTVFPRPYTTPVNCNFCGKHVNAIKTEIIYDYKVWDMLTKMTE
jgi:hypothetical protein